MTPQELQFELMKKASFNGFDGEQVVMSLQRHPDIWSGAVMDDGRLIKLRDLPRYWSVDTLYITPTAGKEDQLESLARDWNADEVGWIGGEEACRMLGSYSPALRANPKQILRVWWD